MSKKYELTDESISYNDRKLYRIRALKDFSNIKKGDIGGYIESEKNLSQEGNCWIYDDAKVYDNAIVFDYAKISGHAKIYGNTKVYDNAIISDNAEVSGYAQVFGYAEVSDYAEIHNNAKVYENAKVFGHALVYGNALVSGYALVYDHASVYNHALVCNNAKIYGHAEVYSYALVYDNAVICDNAEIYSNAKIYGNAIVSNSYKITGKVIDKFDDILEIQNPKGRLVTAILRDDKIYYNIGCQDEISEEVFKNRIKNEDGGLEKNPHREFYYKIIDIVNSYFKDKIKSYKNNSRRQK